MDGDPKENPPEVAGAAAGAAVGALVGAFSGALAGAFIFSATALSREAYRRYRESRIEEDYDEVYDD